MCTYFPGEDIGSSLSTKKHPMDVIVIQRNKFRKNVLGELGVHTLTWIGVEHNVRIV